MHTTTCTYCGKPFPGEDETCPHCGADNASPAAPHPAGGPEEANYYLDEHGVRVTGTRVIAGGQTFSLANVTAVGLARKHAARKLPILVLILLLLGVLSCLGNEAWGAAVVVSLLAVLTVIWMARLKPWHVLRLTTASGRIDAYESKDQGQVRAIVDAINEAIVARG